MHLGHAPGKLGWGLARVPARKALVESAADVANERLVRFGKKGEWGVRKAN